MEMNSQLSLRSFCIHDFSINRKSDCNCAVEYKLLTVVKIKDEPVVSTFIPCMEIIKIYNSLILQQNFAFQSPFLCRLLTGLQPFTVKSTTRRSKIVLEAVDIPSKALSGKKSLNLIFNFIENSCANCNHPILFPLLAVQKIYYEPVILILLEIVYF